MELLDCDVEEPNAHLFLKPTIDRSQQVTTPVPLVDLSKCNFCKKCQQICRFNALAVVGKKVLVTNFAALRRLHAGLPEGAISETGRELGMLNFGHRDGIGFINGRLRVGEAMSPP